MTVRRVGKKLTERNYPKEPQASAAGVLLDVAVSSLRPNGFNYNEQSPQDFLKLVASVRKYGMRKPVVVRRVHGQKGYEIVGGEHRWLAAVEVGLKKLPVYDLGLIPDAQAKELCILLNELQGSRDEIRFGDLLGKIAATNALSNLSSVIPLSLTQLQGMTGSIAFNFEKLPEVDTRVEADKALSADPDLPGPLEPRMEEVALTFEAAQGESVRSRLRAVDEDFSVAVRKLLDAWKGRPRG